MPGGNRMGPMGQGPMTGRGMGWCGGANGLADVQPRGPGFGMGRGGGRGRGWRHRHWLHATGLTGRQRSQMGLPGSGTGFPLVLSREQELAALKQQAESLEQTLAELKSRIQELSKPASEPGATSEK